MHKVVIERSTDSGLWVAQCAVDGDLLVVCFTDWEQASDYAKAVEKATSIQVLR